jgi:predicted nucleotidyltransferase
MELRNSRRAPNKRTSSRGSDGSGNGQVQTPFKLVTRPQIRAVVDRIIESVHPKKIILFGSYAYGKPTIDSDVDFLVVMESDERPAKRAIRIARHLLDVPFPMDILVRTPTEITERLQMEDYFMREVIRRGRIMYAR